MFTERKVRADAKLERLEVEQKKRVLVWLEEENRTYVEVAGLVKTEFGVSVGKSAVGYFWQRHVLPQRYREEVEAMEGIGELPETRFAEATLKLARMHAWEALSQPEPQVAKAERLLRMVWRAERMALARERLEWEKQRVARAGQTTPAAREDTPTEKAEKPRTGARGLSEAVSPHGGAPEPRVFPGYSGESRDRTRTAGVRAGSAEAPAKGKGADRVGRKAGELAGKADGPVVGAVAIKPDPTVVTPSTTAVADTSDTCQPALPQFLQISPEATLLTGIKMAKHFGRDTAKLEAGFARLFPGYSADNPDSIPKRTVEENLRLKIEIQKVAGLGYAYLEAELAKRAAWVAARANGVVKSAVGESVA
ncbi:MAG: hypothetical protein V4773_12500 [Verrucomicrobiota bacterium]